MNPFVHQIRVRWSEVDPLGVVFNPNYLVYADIAATEFYRHIGAMEAQIEDLMQLYVIDTHVRYLASARYDELIHVTVEPSRIGNSSLELKFTIDRDDTRLTEIRMTCCRAIDGKATPLSDAFRQYLAPKS